MKIAIIGAGLFGCSTAIKIKEKYKKYDVHLYEKKNKILYSASGKNQFRCHRGYHYPRSELTINECKNGVKSFKEYYDDCFIKSENFYAISKHSSYTNFSEYLNVLEKNELKYKIKKNKIFNYSNIENTVIVDEDLIDVSKVRKKTIEYINKLKIKLKLNTKVHISKKFLKNFDMIVLATYDNNNNNLKNFKSIKEKFYYQLVEKIIIRTPSQYNKFSAVVIDGPFMCIDPYIKDGFSILGNVKKSVIEKSNSIFNNFNEVYKKKLDQYLVKDIKSSKYNDMINHLSDYFNYTDDFKYESSFFVIRCTKKNNRDERVTKINSNDKIVKIFSGKWVNCFNAANDILKLL